MAPAKVRINTSVVVVKLIQKVISMKSLKSPWVSMSILRRVTAFELGNIDVFPSCIFTLPAAAGAKYYDERVCLSVCPRGYLRDHTRDLYQFCACCLWPWLGPPPTMWRNPKGKGQFWGFLPHWQCIVQHSIWDPYKNGWIDRHAVWDGEWAWLEEKCVTWRDDLQRERGNFVGKHVPDKPNTPNNCELDWSIQRNTTAADAWLQALDVSIICREVGGGIAHRVRSLISKIALLCRAFCAPSRLLSCCVEFSR